MMHGCKEECVNCVRLSCYRFVDGFLPNLHDYHIHSRTMQSAIELFSAYNFGDWLILFNRQ